MNYICCLITVNSGECKIKFKDNEFISEQIIFQGNIGRIRDIKIQKETGELYMLSDNGELWRMYK